MATREERAVNLTITSATDLKKVVHFGKQASYVVAYIYSNLKKKTRIDKDGGVNPTWNSRLALQADEDQFQQGRLYVTLEIYSHGTISDKIVGTARIPVSEASKGPDGSHYMELEVHRPSGRIQGTLKVSIALAEKRAVPVYDNRMPAAYGAGTTAYGIPQQGYVQGYPPQGYPPQGYYPPQQGYYPPQQGYYPQQQGYSAQQGRSGMGGLGGYGGAGLGLGAGLLGGLVVGDMLGGGFGGGGGCGGGGGGCGGGGCGGS